MVVVTHSGVSGGMQSQFTYLNLNQKFKLKYP